MWLLSSVFSVIIFTSFCATTILAQTPVPGTVTIGTCTTSYNVYTMYHGANGSPQFNLGFQDCETQCFINSACTGFDFITAPLPGTASCYFYFTTLAPLDLYNDVQNASFYNVTSQTGQCSSSSSTTSFALSSSLTGISSSLAGISSSLAGISNSSPTSIMGISSSNIITTTTAGSTTGATTTTAQTALGCPSVSQVLGGTHAVNGVLLPGVNTNSSCQQACFTNVACIAYEINLDLIPTQCFIHVTPINVANDFYNDDPKIDFYLISRVCTSSTSSASGPMSTTAAVSSTTSRIIGCPAYSSTQGANALGAVPFPLLTNANDCQNRCNIDPTCVAYEISTSSSISLCWLHVNIADLTPLYGTAGVTIYILTGRTCTSLVSATSTTSGPLSSTTNPTTTASSASTSATTTTGPTTTLPITTTGIAPCFVVNFNILTLTHSIGATPYPGLSAAACRTFCINTAACVAYELDTNQNTASLCWIHTNSTNLQLLYSDPLITQFQVATRTPCASSTTSTASTTVGTTASSTSAPPTTTTINPQNALCANYNAILLTQSVGATGIPGITTIAACQSLCSNTLVCVAFEIDTNPNSAAYCFIHTIAMNLMTQYDAPTVTQYVLIPPRFLCTASSTTAPTTTTSPSTAPLCTVSYSRSDNVNIPGGTPNRASTLTDCQNACTANPYCIAIDVNSNGGTFFCYIITVRLPFTSFPGNTHYEITRGSNCATVITTVATTSQATTTTTTPPNPLSGCATLRVSVGYNSDGGVLSGTNLDVNTCISTCLLNPLCLVVDYNQNNGNCYTHNSLAGSQLSTCCLRFECVATSPCTDLYDSYPGQAPSLSLGAVQNGITAVSDCQNACQAQNCTRFVFAVSSRNPGQVCYLYYTSTVQTQEAVSYQAGVVLYERRRCIASPNVSPPTTTAAPPSLSPTYCPVDLVFVVDSSGSIRDNQPPGIDNYALIGAFLGNVSSLLNIGGTGYDHVALVLFSTTAQIIFNFNKYTSLPAVVNAVTTLPYIGDITNTPAALQLAYQLFTDPTQGIRTRSAKIMILITDGVVTQAFYPAFQPAISQLASLSVTRFAVGVTNLIDVSQLILFASSANAYTTVLDFGSLTTAVPLVGLYLNAVNCNGNVIFTSPLTSTSTSTTAPTTSTSTTTRPTTTSTAPAVVFSSSLTTSTAATTTTTIAGQSTGRTSTRSQVVASGEGTFGAGSTVTQNGAISTLSYTNLTANRNNVYSTLSGIFSATVLNGYYFLEVCAGVLQGTTAEIRNSGAYPLVGFSWLSTSQNGITSGCRGGILTMTRGVSVHMTQTGGGVYSDNQLQTSWSLFSVTDTMANPNANGLLSATYTSTFSIPNTAIPFTTNVYPPGLYNSASGAYTCGSSGIYFFSFSVGVSAGTTAQVQLVGADTTYELIRTSTISNGVTTLDRSVIAYCLNGFVTIQLVSGQVTPGTTSTNLISFTAFPYAPSSGIAAAWGLYRSTNLTSTSGATDPLPFDTQNVQTGISLNNNVVTLNTGGYYYVYLSGGSQPGQAFTLSLKRNGVTLFNVLHTVTNDNGVDTLGHGMVVLFRTGDQIKVVCEANSALFSSSTGLHTSFIGMLLYTS